MRKSIPMIALWVINSKNGRLSRTSINYSKTGNKKSCNKGVEYPVYQSSTIIWDHDSLHK